MGDILTLIDPDVCERCIGQSLVGVLGRESEFCGADAGDTS